MFLQHGKERWGTQTWHKHGEKLTLHRPERPDWICRYFIFHAKSVIGFNVIIWRAINDIIDRICNIRHHTKENLVHSKDILCFVHKLRSLRIYGQIFSTHFFQYFPINPLTHRFCVFNIRPHFGENFSGLIWIFFPNTFHWVSITVYANVDDLWAGPVPVACVNSGARVYNK